MRPAEPGSGLTWWAPAAGVPRSCFQDPAVIACRTPPLRSGTHDRQPAKDCTQDGSERHGRQGRHAEGTPSTSWALAVTGSGSALPTSATFGTSGPPELAAPPASALPRSSRTRRRPNSGVGSPEHPTADQTRRRVRDERRSRLASSMTAWQCQAMTRWASASTAGSPASRHGGLAACSRAGGVPTAAGLRQSYSSGQEAISEGMALWRPARRCNQGVR